MSQFDESKLSRILARRIIAPEDRSQFLPLCTPIYCPDNNGVKASQVTIIDPNLNTFFDDADSTNTRSKYIGSKVNSKTNEVTQQPHEVQNIINIDLNKSVSRDYFVPYEVELKSDADIVSVIKSDFAAYFKNRVSNEIFEQLVALHTASTIPTINMGATLAEAFGEVLTSFISQGTGQKFSIYKYNNGAPVIYSEDSSQPSIDKDINQTTDMVFTTKDDINVPALYYVEQPTLILPNTTYVNYQTELCNGNIKEYARKMINVETATSDFSQLGKGVFGTNDTFAVAFSSPSIKLVPDTNFYGYRLCCTMLYGVKLIHKHNLRLFI